MQFRFEFRPVSDMKDLNALRSFLLSQSLEYPGYNDWIEKSMFEIEIEYKKTVLAFSQGVIVGDAIVQPHKDIVNVLELKNARIHPSFRERYFANFMLKQAEKEYGVNFDLFLVDVRKNQTDMIRFLSNYGFAKVAEAPLYDKNIPEIVMVKNLKSNILENKIIEYVNKARL